MVITSSYMLSASMRGFLKGSLVIKYLIYQRFRYHQCLKIQKTNGAFIKLYYQPNNEIWKPVGKLHIETHPKNIVAFSTLLNRLKAISKGVYFIATDVAFDVPVPLNNILVTSNTGRKMNLFNGTRYFGGKVFYHLIKLAEPYQK
ncbi:hypothetical protein [Peribacillus sp. NPDC055009]